MPMANIACGRSIATDPRARPGRRRWWPKPGLAALLMAATAAAPPPPQADPAFPFAREIEAFASADAAGPAIRDATLFLGSSSIRLWDIAGSFAGRATVNRGFGGATTADVLRHYRRLLPPARPRAIIVYVGENDLAAGTPPDAVGDRVTALLGRLRRDYPDAAIAYLSLKPSPLRWGLRPGMTRVNDRVAAWARARGIACLDVGALLLAPDGLPDASLFRPDGLHLNARGYARWTQAVTAWLDRQDRPGTAPRTASGIPGRAVSD